MMRPMNDRRQRKKMMEMSIVAEFYEEQLRLVSFHVEILYKNHYQDKHLSIEVDMENHQRAVHVNYVFSLD